MSTTELALPDLPAIDPKVAVDLLLIEAKYMKMSAYQAMFRAGVKSDNLACRDLSPFGR
jgi:hypothetical protein